MGEDDDEESDEEVSEETKKKNARKQMKLKREELARQTESKIMVCTEASQEKYKQRKKPFASQDIPKSEKEEEKKVKEVKPAVATGGKKGKKKNFVDDDFEKPKTL